MLSSYNLKNKQTIQISGLILQYCSATTLYRRLTIPILHTYNIQTYSVNLSPPSIIYCSGSRDAVTSNDTKRHVLNACLTLLLKSKIIQNIDRGGDLVYIVRS